MNYIYVFIGGGIGSVLRFGISRFFNIFYKGNIPIATFVSNSISCCFLAIFVFFAHKYFNGSERFKYLFITGVCGGFSTFSTFSFETLTLIKNGFYLIAGANIFVSILVCLLILWLLL